MSRIARSLTSGFTPSRRLLLPPPTSIVLMMEEALTWSRFLSEALERTTLPVIVTPPINSERDRLWGLSWPPKNTLVSPLRTTGVGGGAESGGGFCT